MKLDLGELTGGKVKDVVETSYQYRSDSVADGSCVGGGETFGKAVSSLASWTDKLPSRRSKEAHVYMAPIKMTTIDAYTLEDGRKVYHGYRTFGPESSALSKVNLDLDGKVVLRVRTDMHEILVEEIAQEVAEYDNWI